MTAPTINYNNSNVNRNPVANVPQGQLLQENNIGIPDFDQFAQTKLAQKGNIYKSRTAAAATISATATSSAN